MQCGMTTGRNENIALLSKALLLITALSIFLIACANRQESPPPLWQMPDRPPWLFEGWACKPQQDRMPQEDCKEGPDYLYLVSQISITDKDLTPEICKAIIEEETKRAKFWDRAFDHRMVVATDHEGSITFFSDHANQLSQAGVSGCCLFNRQKGICLKPESFSAECLCTVHVRFKGGRRALEEQM